MKNKTLAVLFALSAIVAAFSSTANGQDAEPEENNGWTSMFNGENLEGWTPKIRGFKLGENYADTFRVQDGVIKVRYDKYEGDFDERFGHLFYKTSYSNYIMKMEYRFVGEQAPGGPGWAFRNSGIMIHGQDPSTMKLDQDFPVSVEVQLLGGGTEGDRPTLNLCTPGTNVVMKGELFKPHCTSSNSQTYRGDGWVSCEIEVRGNGLIRHRVEGETVLEYTNAQLDPRDPISKVLLETQEMQLTGGSISLQAESHNCEFRNLYIRELKVDDAVEK